MHGLRYILLCLFLAPACVLAQKLVVASFWSMPTVSIYEDLVARMYCAAGLQIQFQRYPIVRAREEADAGRVDASLIHHASNISDKAHLLPLREPLPPLQLVYVALRSFPEMELNEQTKKQYRVGHFPGLQAIADTWWSPQSISVNGAYQQLYSLLKARRIDVALVGYWEAPALLKAFGELRQVGHRVISLPVHHYVNERHRELLPRLEQRLRDLKADPGLEPLIKQAKARYLARSTSASGASRPIDCHEFQSTEASPVTPSSPLKLLLRQPNPRPEDAIRSGLTL